MVSAFKLCQTLLHKYYGSPGDLKGLYITLCILNGLLSLTAIVGNATIIFALSKASSIPSNSRILMKCLAISDLGNGVLGHPCYIAVILKIQEEFTCENISEVLMVFFILGAFLTTASLMTVFLMGVDRFLAIHLHLRYNELITPRRIKMVIACSWIFSFTTISIGVFLNFQFGEIILLCAGYGGLLVLTIVYIKIFLVARHHAASIHSQSQVATHQTNITSMAQKRNLAIKIFYVYIVFLLCNCPYFIAETVLVTSSPFVRIQAAIHITTILVMLNSSLNPLLFGWKMKEIRQIVKFYFKKYVLSA